MLDLYWITRLRTSHRDGRVDNGSSQHQIIMLRSDHMKKLYVEPTIRIALQSN